MHMAMRMKELSERSGLPRTTIHHYLRESLLSPASRSAPNAAEYTDAHLDRLRLITRLRTSDEPTGAGLSIAEVRDVLGFVDAGVHPEAATRLVRASGAEAGRSPIPPPPTPGGWATIEALAEAAGVDERLARRIAEAGLLDVEAEMQTPEDLMVLLAAAEACERYEVDPSDLAPFGDLMREVGNYGATLGELHAARSGGSVGGEDEERGPLAPSLRGLNEALLWRAFAGV